MLIDVFSGSDRSSARCEGTFYFSSPPDPGEQVELAGEYFTVTKAWHKPDISHRGAKFAILVAGALESPRQSERPDKAGAFA